MVHQYWLIALPILVLDAAQGAVATPGGHARKSNPSPPGLRILPLIRDNSDDYNSYLAEVAAGNPPQKMNLNLDIAKSTTCMCFVLATVVLFTNTSRVYFRQDFRGM
jgi:hypothetical protein